MPEEHQCALTLPWRLGCVNHSPPPPVTFLRRRPRGHGRGSTTQSETQKTVSQFSQWGDFKIVYF